MKITPFQQNIYANSRLKNSQSSQQLNTFLKPQTTSVPLIEQQANLTTLQTENLILRQIIDNHQSCTNTRMPTKRDGHQQLINFKETILYNSEKKHDDKLTEKFSIELQMKNSQLVFERNKYQILSKKYEENQSKLRLSPQTFRSADTEYSEIRNRDALINQLQVQIKQFQTTEQTIVQDNKQIKNNTFEKIVKENSNFKQQIRDLQNQTQRLKYSDAEIQTQDQGIKYNKIFLENESSKFKIKELQSQAKIQEFRLQDYIKKEVNLDVSQTKFTKLMLENDGLRQKLQEFYKKEQKFDNLQDIQEKSKSDIQRQEIMDQALKVELLNQQIFQQKSEFLAQQKQIQLLEQKLQIQGKSQENVQDMEQKDQIMKLKLQNQEFLEIKSNYLESQKKIQLLEQILQKQNSFSTQEIVDKDQIQKIELLSQKIFKLEGENAESQKSNSILLQKLEKQKNLIENTQKVGNQDLILKIQLLNQQIYKSESIQVESQKRFQTLDKELELYKKQEINKDQEIENIRSVLQQEKLDFLKQIDKENKEFSKRIESDKDALKQALETEKASYKKEKQAYEKKLEKQQKDINDLSFYSPIKQDEESKKELSLVREDNKNLMKKLTEELAIQKVQKTQFNQLSQQFKKQLKDKDDEINSLGTKIIDLNYDLQNALDKKDTNNYQNIFSMMSLDGTSRIDQQQNGELRNKIIEQDQSIAELTQDINTLINEIQFMKNTGSRGSSTPQTKSLQDEIRILRTREGILLKELADIKQRNLQNSRTDDGVEKQTFAALQKENTDKFNLIQIQREEIKILKSQRDEFLLQKENEKQNLLVSNIDGRSIKYSMATTKDAYITELQRLYEQIEQQEQEMKAMVTHVRDQEDKIQKLSAQTLTQKGQLFEYEQSMRQDRNGAIFQSIRVNSPR